MSSSTQRIGFFVSRANQSISTGVHALRCSSGKLLVQRADHAAVPLVLRLVVQPADDVHLGAAVVDRLLPAGEDLLVVHQVALGVAQVGAKRTERAAIHAHVRGVEVRVDVVVGRVAVLPLADQIGQLADFGQRRIVAVERQPVVERQPLAGFDLLANRLQQR